MKSEDNQKFYKLHNTNTSMTSDGILGKTVLLVIVLALIGFLYTQTIEPTQQEQQVDISNLVENQQQLIEITKETEKPTSRQIVTDRFTQEIDEDGVVVVVDGSNAYAVRKGTVIVNDNIIKVTDEEYSVDFTQNPRIIISSN